MSERESLKTIIVDQPTCANDRRYVVVVIYGTLRHQPYAIAGTIESALAMWRAAADRDYRRPLIMNQTRYNAIRDGRLKADEEADWKRTKDLIATME